jgi:hypothetical protein
MKTRMSRRRLRLLAAGVVTATAFTLVPTMQSASADPAPDPTGYASADYVTTGSIKPQLGIGGAVGGLLGPLINPVLSGLVNPLMQTVANLPRQMAEYLAGLVNQSGLEASNPVRTDEPSVLFNNCDNSLLGASSSNPYCYQMFQFGLPSNPLLSIDYEQTAGWTVTDTSDHLEPVKAQAHTNAFTLNVLGIPISLNAESIAEVSCPTVVGGTPTAHAVLRTDGLLGGLVSSFTADTQNGWSDVYFNGQNVTNTDTWAAGMFNGSPVNLKLDSNGMFLKINLSPKDLLSSLGLSVAGDLLSMVAPSSDAALQVFIGPGQLVSGTDSASAWGGNWGFDLSAHLEIGVAGLATIKLDIPTALHEDGGTVTGGNLLAMKISYAACGTGLQKPADAIPPGVN